jgi:hypothetical protein
LNDLVPYILSLLSVKAKLQVKFPFFPMFTLAAMSRYPDLCDIMHHYESAATRVRFISSVDVQGMSLAAAATPMTPPPPKIMTTTPAAAMEATVAAPAATDPGTVTVVVTGGGRVR